jgi:hypothetical protein
VTTSSTGITYQGYYKNCLKHGYGSEINTKTGDVYIGLFHLGKYGGKGCLISKNKEVYKGDFKNGKKHGFGVWKKAMNNGSKSKYKGYWSNNMKHGIGQFT